MLVQNTKNFKMPNFNKNINQGSKNFNKNTTRRYLSLKRPQVLQERFKKKGT